jgi:hypothetical protein
MLWTISSGFRVIIDGNLALPVVILTQYAQAAVAE